MKTYFYKLIDNNENIVGYISSLDFRYYNEISKKILCCTEDLAQYAMYNNQLYRTYTFNNFENNYKKEYKEVAALLISEEEYKQQNSEQK